MPLTVRAREAFHPIEHDVKSHRNIIQPTREETGWRVSTAPFAVWKKWLLHPIWQFGKAPVFKHLADPALLAASPPGSAFRVPKTGPQPPSISGSVCGSPN